MVEGGGGEGGSEHRLRIKMNVLFAKGTVGRFRRLGAGGRGGGGRQNKRLINHC